MPAETLAFILDTLNNCIKNEKLHFISYQFEKLVPLIRKENKKMIIVRCRQYYLFDDFLNDLLEKKNAASSFEEAASFRSAEKKYILEKGWDHLSLLRSEPGFFSCKGEAIECHLGNSKQEELLINLIGAYHLDSNAH